MGVAMLGGVPFRLDPTSVAWEYEVKSSVTNTIGGKIVQIYGVHITNLIVQGSFGAGAPGSSGWEDQLDFLDQTLQWSQKQIQMAPSSSVTTGSGNQISVPGGETLTFFYPTYNWKFEVYLVGFNQPGEATSVVQNNQIIAPQWALNLFIVQDDNFAHPKATVGLDKVKDTVIQQYLNRLSDGVGWIQKDFNGPNPDWKTSLLKNLMPDSAPGVNPPNAPPTQDQINQAINNIPIFGHSGLGGPVGGGTGTAPHPNPENPNSPNFGT